jgi:hypothetical protein
MDPPTSREAKETSEAATTERVQPVFRRGAEAVRLRTGNVLLDSWDRDNVVDTWPRSALREVPSESGQFTSNGNKESAMKLSKGEWHDLFGMFKLPVFKQIKWDGSPLSKRAPSSKCYSDTQRAT